MSRYKHLDSLREELKSHTRALRDFEIARYQGELSRQDPGSTGYRASQILLKTYREMNMRQLWHLTTIYRWALDQGRHRYPPQQHRLELAVYYAGLDYYDAKRPGLKGGLMLRRLSGA